MKTTPPCTEDSPVFPPGIIRPWPRLVHSSLSNNRWVLQSTADYPELAVNDHVDTYLALNGISLCKPNLDWFLQHDLLDSSPHIEALFHYLVSGSAPVAIRDGSFFPGEKLVHVDGLSQPLMGRSGWKAAGCSFVKGHSPERAREPPY